jgi:hypothetical protein
MSRPLNLILAKAYADKHAVTITPNSVVNDTNIVFKKYLPKYGARSNTLAKFSQYNFTRLI